MRTMMKGALAGLVGVAGMAGVITTLRRAILTSDELSASRTADRDLRIGADGLLLGLGLWGFGFNVLLPAIGAHPGTWTWKRREFVLTLSAHATYGLATAATLRLFRTR